MKESNRTEKSPRLSNSKNLEYFKTAGILIWKSFTFVQNFALIFGIPEIGSILKPREFQVEGVSLLSLKLSVFRKLSHFEGELQSETSPRLFQFQKSGLFQNRGNFNLEGFQGKMKLPIFGKFSRSSREFHPKFTLIFGIPEFKSILKPREY